MRNEISAFLQERIDAGDFPSAVYLVAEKGEIVMQDALGFAVVEPERIEARLDTVYDLASLTKVLVTGLLAARFVEKDDIELNCPVSAYLPEFNLDDKRGVTVKNLLAHNSGLIGWLPLYLLTNDPSDVLAVIAKRRLEYETGQRVVYSDPNFITLGKIIEMIADKPLDMVFNDLVRNEVGISSSDTAYEPLRDTLLTRIAASEKGNEFEKNTCVELGYIPSAGGFEPFYRTDVIWGEVHDLNAYFLGGVAGHAGLFSSTQEVFKIALQFLPNYSILLKPETCELFRKNFTPGMNEHRSFAFQLATTPESAAGTQMSPESFGHLGFTGTSLWIDPVKERVFILLTNRTHNHLLPFVNLNSVRRHFHDLAVGQLECDS